MNQFIKYFVATLTKRYQSELGASIYDMRPFGKKTFQQILDEAMEIAPARFYGNFSDFIQYAEPSIIPFDLPSIQDAGDEIISNVHQVLIDLCAFQGTSPSNNPYDYFSKLINKKEFSLKFNLETNQPLLEVYYLFNVEDENSYPVLQDSIRQNVLKKCRTFIKERRPIYSDKGLFEEIIERIGNTNNPKRRVAYEIVEGMQGPLIPIHYRSQMIETIQENFHNEILDGLVIESPETTKSFSINFAEINRLLKDKKYLGKLEYIKNGVEGDARRINEMKESIINLNIDRIKPDFEEHMKDMPLRCNMNANEILREWTETAIYPSEMFNIEKDNNYLTSRLRGRFLVQDKKMELVKIVDPSFFKVAHGKHNIRSKITLNKSSFK